MIDWMPARVCGLRAMLAVSVAAAGAEPATGLDRTGMNAAIRPQDDLFAAMNGKWLDDTAIPPDKAEYGALNQLRDRSDERIKALIEEMSAGTPVQGSASAQVAAFYRAFVDTEVIDRAGIKGLDSWLGRIEAMTDRVAVAQWLGHAQGLFRT